jgi:hypothetical protein
MRGRVSLSSTSSVFISELLLRVELKFSEWPEQKVPEHN